MKLHITKCVVEIADHTRKDLVTLSIKILNAFTVEE